MRYWTGPYMWDVLPYPHWRSPIGCVGSIDLRPLSAQAQAVVASGVGFFATDDLTDLGLLGPYTLLGQGDVRSLTPAAKDRSNFAAALGLATVNGTTLVECLWDVLTVQARPIGDTGPKPIIPTTARKLELYLGGHSLVMSKPFDLAMPEATNVKLCLQEDYRVVQDETAKGLTSDPKLDQKVLGYWGLKYGVPDPENYFIPADMVKVGPLAPATTLTDDFTRADQTGLGTAAGGWSWTTVAGAANIVSNQASIPSSAALYSVRAESDLSSADHYAQVDIVTIGVVTHSGGATRFAGAATTYYQAVYFKGDGKYYVSKVVTGTETHLGTAVAITTSLPEAYKCEINGSTLKGYQAGVERRSETDTSITANTRTGIAGYRESGATLDNWSAADLAAAAATAKLLTLLGVGA